MTVFSFSEIDFPITTGLEFQNKEIEEYLGVVIADITPGRHVGKDFLAGLRNLFGGRSFSWEKTLRNNQEKALRELVRKSKDMDADGLISLNIEDEAIGGGGMMNIKVMATAVKFK